MPPDLKAPFPYFGGKSTVAAEVWDRFGDVDNYVEPFAGSAAVLLRRPDSHRGRIETINDADCFLANFWRATRCAPELVVDHCDWPVSEVDLHARHRWLMLSPAADDFRERMRTDPEYFDPKVAGWWVWGACCWIGSGWCSDSENGATWIQRPQLEEWNRPNKIGDQGEKRARLAARHKPGTAIHAQVPALAANDGRGTGVLKTGRPQLGDAYDIGRGVNASPTQKMPALGGRSKRDVGNGVNRRHTLKCEQRREWLLDWFGRLQDRFREVRVCYGHWARICDSNSTLTRLGTVGAFLDPPYRKTLKDGTRNRAGQLYTNDGTQDVNALCDEVEAWCLKWGGDPNIRIALCGLEGEYDLPGWECFAWKTAGGYGNQSDGIGNSARERIWFSPACAKPRSLF